MATVTFYQYPQGGNWWADRSGIKTFAEEKIDGAITERTAVLNNLYTKLVDLNSFLPSFLDIGLFDTDSINFDIGSITIPGYPTRPTIESPPTDFPAEPSDVSLGSVAPVQLGTEPVYTDPGLTIRDIAPPTKFNKTAPTHDALPKRVIPDVTDQTLPNVPTLRDLGGLPTEPQLLNIQFDGILPENLDTPPNIDFRFTEQDYQSILNDLLKDKLYSLVLNLKQTGLSDAVLKQMWDKEREITDAQADREEEDAINAFGRRGWNMPQGDEYTLILKAREKAKQEGLAAARSHYIENARLEQVNFQFAFTQSIALEGQLLTLHNNVQQRSFESAKFEIQAVIELYGLKVSYHNAGVTLYGIMAQVYKDRWQAEFAKLELYGKQLEAKKLIGELNRQDIDLYLAQLKGVEQLYNIIKAKLEAVKLQLDSDELILKQFDSEIRAFVSEIQAKSLEYDGYKSELSGEEIKAKMIDTLANVFGKRVDAYTATGELRLKKLDSDIKINLEVPLETLKQRTEVYKAKIDAKVAQIEGINKKNIANTQIYETDAKVIETITGAQVESLKAELAKNVAIIDSTLKAFHENVLILEAQKEFLVEAKLKETQLLAQIAASIGSTIHMGANISGSSTYDTATFDKIIA